MEEIIHDMESKGLITIKSPTAWLDKAIERKDSNCTISLAYLVLHTSDNLDKLLRTTYLKYHSLVKIEINAN